MHGHTSYESLLKTSQGTKEILLKTTPLRRLPKCVMIVCVMGGAAGGRAERVEPQLGLLQLTLLPVLSDEVGLELHDHPQPRQDHLQEAVAAALQEPESLHAPDHLALDPAGRHQGEL